tara:strand:+ start:211 stop:918 length:708 start_codon:yes stop_codon:yes gene_type:complete
METQNDVYERRKAVLGQISPKILYRGSSEEDETGDTKSVERYKEHMEELQDVVKKLAGSHSGYAKVRARKAKDHYNRARNLEGRTDVQNRIDILNGDRNIYNECQSRANIREDPVYQMVRNAWANDKEEFKKLREFKKLKYENNSRKNPQAKRHAGFFGDYLFHVLRDIENRTMTEEEYTDILNGGLMAVYEKSKEKMDKIDLRKMELGRKIRETGVDGLTEGESLEAVMLLLRS